jgi:hypothetical protein
VRKLSGSRGCGDAINKGRQYCVPVTFAPPGTSRREALYDPETGVLAHRVRMERRLNQDLPNPPPLSDLLSKERINILLVTARPYEQDVHYRSISRPLVDLIQKASLPAHVHLLRPPTFDELREHLAAHPHFYHILHFDGHGGYQGGGRPNSQAFRGPEGRLVFEKQDGEPDPVTAADLSDLLREHAMPIVVLNACPSRRCSTPVLATRSLRLPRPAHFWAGGGRWGASQMRSLTSNSIEPEGLPSYRRNLA